MQVTYLLNVSMFDLLFFCIFFMLRESDFSREIIHDLTFEVQIASKISALQYYLSNYRKIVELRKISINLKIVKPFTRPKQPVSLRKLFSLSPPNIPSAKTLLRLFSKHFLREIYRIIQTFAFKVLQESSSWASSNGAV